MRGDIVKSAGRVLEVLEYFDRMRSDASVMEISRALEYPQSSTSGLLKSLASLGYLSYNPYQRRYAPTLRVALLGSWKAPHLGNGQLLQMLEELGEETRETIILGEQPGLVVRYIMVVPSRQTMRLHVGPGMIRPLVGSGMGMLFLSTYPEAQIRALLKRINASLKSDEPIFRLADLEPELEEIRSRGYSISVNRITRGAGVVSTMMPSIEGEPPLALSIGGFSETINTNAEAFANLMKAAIRRHLG